LIVKQLRVDLGLFENPVLGNRLTRVHTLFIVHYPQHSKPISLPMATQNKFTIQPFPVIANINKILVLESNTCMTAVRHNLVMSVFFDLKKVYDTIWKYSKLRDLYDAGLCG